MGHRYIFHEENEVVGRWRYSSFNSACLTKTSPKLWRKRKRSRREATMSSEKSPKTLDSDLSGPSTASQCSFHQWNKSTSSWSWGSTASFGVISRQNYRPPDAHCNVYLRGRLVDECFQRFQAEAEGLLGKVALEHCWSTECLRLQPSLPNKRNPEPSDPEIRHIPQRKLPGKSGQWRLVLLEVHYLFTSMTLFVYSFRFFTLNV